MKKTNVSSKEKGKENQKRISKGRGRWKRKQTREETSERTGTVGKELEKQKEKEQEGNSENPNKNMGDKDLLIDLMGPQCPSGGLLCWQTRCQVEIDAKDSAQNQRLRVSTGPLFSFYWNATLEASLSWHKLPFEGPLLHSNYYFTGRFLPKDSPFAIFRLSILLQ